VGWWHPWVQPGAELGAVGLSQALRGGCTPWLWHRRSGTGTARGCSVGHGRAAPLGTHFICLTMVLFPDSPAPAGTKHRSQRCPRHKRLRLRSVLGSPAPGTARGHWWPCQVRGAGQGDYSRVPAGIKAGLSRCG